MDLERMDYQIKKVMSSRRGKLDYTWMRGLWSVVRTMAAKKTVSIRVKAQRIK
jgi:hypothetical protein